MKFAGLAYRNLTRGAGNGHPDGRDRLDRGGATLRLLLPCNGLIPSSPHLVNAFGGSSNVQVAEHVAVTRLRFVLRDSHRADQEALKRAGTAGVMKVSENVGHVIAGQRAPAIAATLNLNLDAPSLKPDQFALKK